MEFWNCCGPVILSNQAHWLISWTGEREQKEEGEEEHEDPFHFDDFSKNQAELCSDNYRLETGDKLRRCSSEKIILACYLAK